MEITRQEFLRYCTTGAASLGLSLADVNSLDQALGGEKRKSPAARPITSAASAPPTVLWLEGAGCSGCSISFLNRISPTAPRTVADVLIQTIRLAYHPTLMAAAGESAVDSLMAAYNKGGYILVVEGGIPTAFGGGAGTVWTYQGRETTVTEAVSNLAARALKIICFGTCSSWGGIPAAGSNPARIMGVGAWTRKPTINIPGCPPHPDWLVAVIAKLIAKVSMPLDSSSRPKFIFNTTVHNRCPLRETEEAKTFGQPGRCLEELGCRGPETIAPCPQQWFNGGVNWCIGAGSVCLGCTSPTFPGNNPFFHHVNED